MRLGPGLLYEGRTLQGARPKLADFCSATMAEFYSAVDRMYIDKSEISGVPTHLESLADHDREPKGTGDVVRIRPYSPADSEVNTAEINRPCPRNFT